MMKPKTKTKENWLVFVDTNILLDFYRLGGESAERQIKLLHKHKNSIILNDQVRMEFLKNRQKVIQESLKSLQKPVKSSLPPILTDYKPAKMLGRHIDNAISKHNEIKKKIELMLTEPEKHDNVYKMLNILFENNTKINLQRPNPIRLEIRELAKKRFELGYPPRKINDTSFGDAINWEWIIKCAQDIRKNHNVLIVSRDMDYGINIDSNLILNDWLKKEFKDRISQKRKIELTNKLTIALKKLDETINPVDEEEEEKIIIKETFFAPTPSIERSMRINFVCHSCNTRVGILIGTDVCPVCKAPIEV